MAQIKGSLTLGSHDINIVSKTIVVDNWSKIYRKARNEQYEIVTEKWIWKDFEDVPLHVDMMMNISTSEVKFELSSPVPFEVNFSFATTRYEMMAMTASLNPCNKAKGIENGYLRQFVENYDQDYHMGNYDRFFIHCRAASYCLPTTGYLADTFKNMCSLDLFSDIKVVTDDGQEIPSYRLILSARSPFFKAMFDGKNFVENNTATVKIVEFDFEVVKLFIDYLHGKTLDKAEMEQHCFGLFRIAHMYQVPELKVKAECLVAKIINDDNAREIFGAAFLYESEIIKTAVAEYYKSN